MDVTASDIAAMDVTVLDVATVHGTANGCHRKWMSQQWISQQRDLIAKRSHSKEASQQRSLERNSMSERMPEDMREKMREDMPDRMLYQHHNMPRFSMQPPPTLRRPVQADWPKWPFWFRVDLRGRCMSSASEPSEDIATTRENPTIMESTSCNAPMPSVTEQYATIIAPHGHGLFNLCPH